MTARFGYRVASGMNAQQANIGTVARAQPGEREQPPASSSYCFTWSSKISVQLGDAA